MCSFHVRNSCFWTTQKFVLEGKVHKHNTNTISTFNIPQTQGYGHQKVFSTLLHSPFQNSGLQPSDNKSWCSKSSYIWLYW
jgi:hypothetical protein